MKKFKFKIILNNIFTSILTLSFSYAGKFSFNESNFESRFLNLMTLFLTLLGLLLATVGIIFSIYKEPSVQFLVQSSYLQDLLFSIIKTIKFLGFTSIILFILTIIPYQEINKIYEINIYLFKDLIDFCAFLGLFITTISGINLYITIKKFKVIIEFVIKTS
ncbi:hypothetical protein QEJ31_02755 [Pigmentibacter sp. JX0631]|uniref:hypothetical protein n=1 Tax=Pigmentibacter sp. JX0631 TaxID=2976982 RepID=UPI002468EB67|nr:hypothetical protein [Pigmentibacter sp. JX0631]WGL60520.1 hypothetical protein QEJ31_02755 [Pigmentibacter sp. JX0631]